MARWTSWTTCSRAKGSSGAVRAARPDYTGDGARGRGGGAGRRGWGEGARGRQGDRERGEGGHLGHLHPSPCLLVSPSPRLVPPSPRRYTQGRGGDGMSTRNVVQMAAGVAALLVGIVYLLSNVG